MAIKELTAANFEETVKENSVVLVDFWAEWCGPCKAMHPAIEDLAEQYEGRVLVGQINVDQEMDLAVRYGVMSIPTLVVIKNGEVVNKVIGAVPKPRLAAMLDEVL